MYLMYVDESGDTGKVGSPTTHFILSAIVINEMHWRLILSKLVVFRRMLRDSKKLKLRDEIHCTDLINRPGRLVAISRNDRLDIIKKCIDWIELQPEIKVFCVSVNKGACAGDVFDTAWSALLMRFENTLAHNNFNTSNNASDKGIIICDNTDTIKLRTLVRRMRHYNVVPNNVSMFGGGARNMKVQQIIEDPVFRDSSNSLLHQMCDVIAYCTRQMYQPNAYMKKKGGHHFFKRLDNCLVRKVSSSRNGIVNI